MSKEIVIAAYDRYLDWLDNFNSDIKQTVYRKGFEPAQRDIEIKIDLNKGFDLTLKNYFINQRK